MKNLKYILSSVFVVTALAGCGQWSQDPLANKDGAFKNGQQKPTEPISEKPMDSEAIRLDTVERYTFREGIAGEFTLKARILEPGYVAKINIENMEAFPGATYNPADGKFTWTPPKGTISGDKGLEESYPLKVSVVGTHPKGGLVLRGQKSVNVYLGKQLSVPEIYSITKPSMDLREGDMTTVTVSVRDPDAGSGTPEMQILPLLGHANISQFVTVSRVFSLGKGEFSITLTIDLSDAELTKNRELFGFSLRALSRFNQVSMPQSVTINVTTSFANLQSTWFDSIEVPMGMKKEYQFMIFDPKEELAVGTPSFPNLPSGASINCSGVYVTRQLCTFTWTPDFTVSAGDYNFSASLTARNQSSQDTLTKSYNLPMKIRVTEAPPTSPVSHKGGQ